MLDELADRLDRDMAALVIHEQERFGRQLHDTLGPQLTALSMLATSLHERLHERSASEVALAAKLMRGIEQAKVDSRALAKGMLPVEVDAEGLMCALQKLADETNLTFPIDCEFQSDRIVAINDNFIATRLFRIAKEAVHNAVKHAHATHLIVRLRDEPQLQLEVEDDGGGFTGASHLSEGNGIRIMRLRSQLIGAQFDIQPGKNGGTIVSCTISGMRDCDD